MEEYVERQRRRYNEEKVEEVVHAATAVLPLASSSSSAGVLNRVHILPLDREVRDRARSWMPELQSSMRSTLYEGDIVLGGKGVVAKTEPTQGGILTSDTEIYLDGPVVPVCRRVQLVLLSEESQGDVDEQESAIFENIL